MSAVRGGNLPNLTAQERGIWDEFFFRQARRTPDGLDQVGSLSEMSKSIENLVAEFEHEFGSLPEHTKEQVLSPEGKRLTIQNARATLYSRTSDEILTTLSERGLFFARPTSIKSRFIIGSCASVRLNAGEGNWNHLKSHWVEWWLPVSSDVAVSPGFRKHTEVIMEIREQRLVRHLNEAIFAQSSSVAGCSPKLVESLAKQR